MFDIVLLIAFVLATEFLDYDWYLCVFRALSTPRLRSRAEKANKFSINAEVAKQRMIHNPSCVHARHGFWGPPGDDSLFTANRGHRCGAWEVARRLLRGSSKGM